MIAQCGRQSFRERHVPEPPTLGRRHVTVPVGPADAELPVHQIDVGPLQRNHLAAPQSRLTAQQRDEVGPRVEAARRVDEPFVLVEVVEPRGGRLSKTGREDEFRQRRDDEVASIERIVGDAFDGFDAALGELATTPADA